MNQSNFDIVPFENRNGSASWRVVGWLHGERVRKNFKTRAEAAAEKATLEVQAAHSVNNGRLELEPRPLPKCILVSGHYARAGGPNGLPKVAKNVGFAFTFPHFAASYCLF